MLLQVPKNIFCRYRVYLEYESYWMWVVVMVITMMDGGRVSQWVVTVPVWTRNQLPVTAAGLGTGAGWWPHTWCTPVFSSTTRAVTCLLYSSTILTFFYIDIVLTIFRDHAYMRILLVVLPVVCMQIYVRYVHRCGTLQSFSFECPDVRAISCSIFSKPTSRYVGQMLWMWTSIRCNANVKTLF